MENWENAISSAKSIEDIYRVFEAVGLTETEHTPILFGSSSEWAKKLAVGNFSVLVPKNTPISDIDNKKIIFSGSTSSNTFNKMAQKAKEIGLKTEDYRIYQVVDGHKPDGYAYVYAIDGDSFTRSGTIDKKTVFDGEKGVSEPELISSEKILDAYSRVMKKEGFKNVAISEFRKELGLSPDEMRNFLVRESAKGSVAMSFGDWSLATEEHRGSAVPLRGKMFVLVRITRPDEIGGIDRGSEEIKKPFILPKEIEAYYGAEKYFGQNNKEPEKSVFFSAVSRSIESPAGRLAYLWKVRRMLGWDREKFDRVLKRLVVNQDIQLHGGDPSLLDDSQIKDSYKDEDKTLFLSVSLRNKAVLESIRGLLPAIHDTEISYPYLEYLWRRAKILTNQQTTLREHDGEGYWQYVSWIFKSLIEEGGDDSVTESANGIEEPAETKFDIHSWIFGWLKIAKGNIFADCKYLQRKHPEYFETPSKVKAHINYVLSKPEYAFPATCKEYTVIVRRNGKNHTLVIELKYKGGKYRIISAIIMTDEQLDHKVRQLEESGGRISAAPGVPSYEYERTVRGAIPPSDGHPLSQSEKKISPVTESVKHDWQSAILNAETMSEIETIFLNALGLSEGTENETLKTDNIFVDTGDKIGGAKKDIWAEIIAGRKTLETEDIEGMDSPTAYKLVNKENVTRNMIDSFRDLGMQPDAVFMIQKVFGSYSQKPDDTDIARLNYVRAADRVREYFKTVITLDNLKNILTQIKNEVIGFQTSPEEKKELDDIKSRIEEQQARFKKASRDKWNDITSSPAVQKRKGYGINKPKADALMREWYREEELKYKNNDKKRYYELNRIYDERENNNPNSVRNQYYALGERFVNIIKGKSEAFNTNMAEAAKIKDFEWLDGGKEKKEKQKREMKEKWVRFVPESVERTGARTVIFNPQDIIDKFGIRGIEYGNYVDKNSAYHHTQMLALSFQDLSDILQIPAEKISHGKRLAIAFGARGTGNASAHYEADRKVINMTKNRGGGSLAHEWGHFFDNILNMVSHKGKVQFSFATEDNIGENISHEIASALSEVRDAMYKGNIGEELSDPNTETGLENTAIIDRLIKESDSPQEAMRYFNTKTDYKGRMLYKNKILAAIAAYIHKKTGVQVQYSSDGEFKTRFYINSRRMSLNPENYWTRPREMFARAFETFVSDELESKGMTNSYLVSGITDKYLREGAPYPQGEERKKIVSAFKKLFEAVRSEQVLENAICITESIEINPDDVDTEPTEKQKEAGNYRKHHIVFHGMEITIENPKGTYRTGIDKDGKEWKSEIHSHYGYIKGTVGKDKDHLDCFIGDNEKSQTVFIVNQANENGAFDEHKIMFGFDDEKSAKTGYLKNYEKGWDRIISIKELSMDDFKKWIESGDTKKPLN